MSDAAHSAVKLALQARRLRAGTPDVDLVQSEPIAVIGLGCRMPGGDGPDGFWRTLERGVDAIREVPRERWDIDAYYDPDQSVPGKMVTRWGSFLADVDGFDAGFFGIAPREAATMDPQHRLLLEVAYEALEDAGEDLERLAGSATGVFVAVYNSDYARQQLAVLDAIDAYTSSGTAHSIASGRISFLFDFHGPSVTVDTACSASLTAVHLACQSLRSGDSDLALAGGASLILGPEPAVSMSKWGMMSRDGRCKAFDSRADGFVRGEGAGVVALKRLSDALAAGDRVRAVIRGTAVNQDGRSANLTAPNGLSQQAVVRQALANGRVGPQDVTYVEAHGTGTSLGDPIEFDALSEVLGRAEPGSRPCALGSVKTNIGHLEAAAGIAGLIKVVLSLERGVIPPHLHFKEPNPHISFAGTRFFVPTESRPWTSEAGPRFAGVSSFGFGGTNAHVVLEETPRLPEPERARAPRSQILPLSAQSEEALRALAGRYSAFLQGEETTTDFEGVCGTAGARRTHLDQRLALVADSVQQMASRLDRFSRGERPSGVAAGTHSRGTHPKVAFVFSGQGPQWWGMGRQLAADEPVFRDALSRCDAAMRRHVSWSLLDELGADESASRLSRTEIAQPALFALQVALAELWRSWGIEPRAVVGHSVGEVAAAHVAGALDLEDASRLVAIRGRVMDKATGLGKMASVELPVADVEALLDGMQDELSVAAVNAPRSTVVSGERAALERFLGALGDRGSFRMLPVDYAFHSPQMEPFRGEIVSALEGLKTSDPRLLLVSGTLGKRIAGRDLEGSYWGRNMRSPVLFANAVDALVEAGCDAFVEIAPHPVLSHSVAATIEARGTAAETVASLRRGQDERATMLAALSTLYVRGASVLWSAVSPVSRFVTLPSYPWQHERHWFDRGGREGASRSSMANVGRATGRPLLGSRLRSPLKQAQFDAEWSTSTLPFLEDHRIQGTVVVPATAFATSLLAAAQELWGAGFHALEDLEIEQPLALGGGSTRAVQIVVDDPEGEETGAWVSSFAGEGQGEWTRHASGRLRHAGSVDLPSSLSSETVGSGPSSAEGLVLYEGLRQRGVELGLRFQCVEHISWGPGRAVARLRPTELGTGLGSQDLPAPLLDACLQPFGAALEDPREPPRELLLPIGVRRLRQFAPMEGALRVQATIREDAGNANDVVTGDVTVWNDAGAPVAELQGVKLKRTDGETFARAITPLRLDSLHHVVWKAQTLAEDRGASGNVLLVGDEGGLTERLARAVAARGGRVACGVAGNSYRARGVDRYELDVERADDFRALLADLQRLGRAPRTAVLLCGPDASSSSWKSSEQVRERSRRVCAAGLSLTQALAGFGAPASPRLVFVTRGTQAVGSEAAAGEGFVEGSLWGLRAVIALEHPELRPMCIDLDPIPHSGEAEALAGEIVGGGGEPQVSVRAGARHVARLETLRLESRSRRSQAAEPRRLECRAPGLLESLVLGPQRRTAPGRGQVEIAVRAAGLNFRDVLRALGMYPGENGPLGDECAGVVTAVGPDVTRFKAGDEVFGIAPGSFADFTLGEASLLDAKPPELSFTEAAAIPSVFGTAAFALRRVAGLKAGDRVLIHAAAGGVGLAAVTVARACGAEVFATAGSAEKRDYLEELGVAQVFDSRNLAFADEILRLTDGRGVDVVLNSLAGEFIPKSLAAVRRAGCFLELGRAGVWTTAQVEALGREIRYEPIFFADTCSQDPDLVRSLLCEVTADLVEGRLALPPIRSFTLDESVAAFRFMSQARHIGKIVLTCAPGPGTERVGVRGGASYLVTGGLGGLGLEVARSFVERGATHLVLAGRSAASERAREAIDELRRRGATVRAVQFDVADAGQTRDLVARLAAEDPPLRGIVHAAGVLDDGPLREQDASRFERVLAPKALGACNLHLATLGLPLEFLVFFSSAASLLGAGGQGSYAAANAFLDALARYRRSVGLEALSIIWGPWAEVGMAARLAARDRARLQERGFASLSSVEGTRLLHELIASGRSEVAVLPVDWRRYAEAEGPEASPFLADLIGSRRLSSPVAETSAFRQLDGVPPARRHGQVLKALQELAGPVLGLDAAAGIDPSRPLKEMGLDSLMAVELRNAVAARSGCRLPATLLFDHPTLDALAHHLLSLLCPVEESQSRAEEKASAEVDAQALRSLSDAEAEALLQKELDALGHVKLNG